MKGGSLPFLSSSFEIKEKEKKHREQRTIEKNKMQRKEGAYLSSLTSTFGMKYFSCLLLSSFNVDLSTFLKP